MNDAVDFKTLFESGPGLYLVLDPEFRIVTASDHYLAATMTEREKIAGRSLFDVFPDNPDDPAATGTKNLRASLEAVLKTGKPHHMAVQQYDIRRPASRGGGFETRYWSPINTPIFSDGKLTHILHRVEDVTEFIQLQQLQRRDAKAHEDLRSRTAGMRMELYQRTQELEEAKLKGFVASSPDTLGLIPRTNLYSLLMDAPAAVCIVRGRDPIIEFVNPKFQHLVAGADVLGRLASEVLPEHGLEALAAAVSQVRRTNEGSVTGEVSVKSDGPDPAVFTFNAQPIAGTGGIDEGVVLFGFDVTAQVEARRRLEELADHLRDADRAKDEFIAIISHELRTPMTSVLGWSRMLALGGLDEAGRLEALEAIDRSTRAQAKLIEDLLDESRIAAGKLRLDLRALDIRGVIEGAMTMVRPQVEARNQTLSSDLEEGHFNVSGDPVRLQQVIVNVVGNAIKFTPEGGAISISLTREIPFAVIRVRDSGRGIEPELLPHVFDRFRQGDATAGDRQGGLGLGLAIARHLVEMHGGSVEAASEGEGKGTTLTLRFPLHESSTNTDEFVDRDPTRDLRLPTLEGVRVLIIEDQADNRRVVAAALQQCGADVQCVGSASEGFERIAAWPPDVLVCDIALPDLDGCSFLRQLRSGDTNESRVPALALTVFGRPGEQARIKDAGFQVFRQKPIDPVDLAHEVARLARA